MNIRLSILILISISFSYCAQKAFFPTTSDKTLTQKAFQYFVDNKFDSSANAYEKAFGNSRHTLAVDRYYAAFAWSQLNHPDKAFYHLYKAAMECNYSNVSELERANEFMRLSSDKRWPPLIKRVKMNLEAINKKRNIELMSQLDSILFTDKFYRRRIDSLMKRPNPDPAIYSQLVQKSLKSDSINQIKVKDIIRRFGWPGIDLVGEKGSSAVFLVIQHSDSLTQVQYLPQLKRAVRKGQAYPSQLALLTDRVLVKQHKAQIYGSQAFTDPITGKLKLYDIKREKEVNERRAAVGLIPIEQYTKLLGFQYSISKSE